MKKYMKWLIVSIVFLVASLIMPIYVLYAALNTTLQTAVNILPNYSANNPATGGLDQFLQQQTAGQNQLLIIVVAVELLLVACFSITMWYTVKCRDMCRNFPTT
jgi:hypothetical protein